MKIWKRLHICDQSNYHSARHSSILKRITLLYMTITLLMLFISPIANGVAGQWTKMSGEHGKDIDVGADGTVIGVGENGKFVRWNEAREAWQMVPNLPNTQALTIAVGTQDHIWALDVDGNAWTWKP